MLQISVTQDFDVRQIQRINALYTHCAIILVNILVWLGSTCNRHRQGVTLHADSKCFLWCLAQAGEMKHIVCTML